MTETCCFHEDFDPVTLAPRGTKCTAAAVSAIVWKDGRVSPACAHHGVDALDEYGRELVKEVRPVKEFWP